MERIAEVMEKFKQMDAALKGTLEAFIAPFAAVLPDARYRKTLHQFVPAMLAAGSPQPARAAAYAPEPPANPWALAKRFFSLLHTSSFSHQDWLQVLYQDARQVVDEAGVTKVLVAVDPVNFEKPYARKLEGISKVYKATPPGSLPQQAPRITWGYPAIFGLILNTPHPAVAYLRLFSYTTPDFLSQPMEWMQAFHALRQCFPERELCVVADAEADDQKLWREANACDLEFIFRATKTRNILVHNPHRHGWEEEELQSLARIMAGRCHVEVAFQHAGRSIPAHVTLDWFCFRLPDQQERYWCVVAETHINQDDLSEEEWRPPRSLVLVTNRPVEDNEAAKQVYTDWVQRGRIEHFYRFLQEDGVKVETIQVRTLERFRRMLILVVICALFVLRLAAVWPEEMIRWLRRVASSTGDTSLDRQGPYLLLRALQRVLDAISLLHWMTIDPPPLEVLPGPT